MLPLPHGALSFLGIGRCAGAIRPPSRRPRSVQSARADRVLGAPEDNVPLRWDALRERVDRHDGRRRDGAPARLGLVDGRDRRRRRGTEPDRRRHASTSAARSSRRGLVNTHHHLYQTLTRARAQQADLFTWLRELYPVWAGIDAEARVRRRAHRARRARLSGCTTVFDHHYVFPRGREGILEAEVQAARELGVRLVASRGSMDLGVLGRRASAGRARRGDRRGTRRDGAAPRRAARARARARASRSPSRPARRSRSPAG